MGADNYLPKPFEPRELLARGIRSGTRPRLDTSEAARPLDLGTLLQSPCDDAAEAGQAVTYDRVVEASVVVMGWPNALRRVFANLEGAQDAKRQRSEVRRPPRSRRTGCFVGICGSIAGGDKTEGFPIRRRVIVVAMAECVAKRRTEPWRTQDGAGRRRQSVSPFLAPFGDLDVPKGFAKNGDTIADYR